MQEKKCMDNSVLEAMVGKERADILVTFVAEDMISYVDAHLGVQDELDLFDDAIDQCIGENPVVQLIQMSDDDAISEFGMRLAIELEHIARSTDNVDSAGLASLRKRLARHYAEWLMSIGPDEGETGEDSEME